MKIPFLEAKPTRTLRNLTKRWRKLSRFRPRRPVSHLSRAHPTRFYFSPSSSPALLPTTFEPKQRDSINGDSLCPSLSLSHTHSLWSAAIELRRSRSSPRHRILKVRCSDTLQALSDRSAQCLLWISLVILENSLLFSLLCAYMLSALPILGFGKNFWLDPLVLWVLYCRWLMWRLGLAFLRSAGFSWNFPLLFAASAWRIEEVHRFREKVEPLMLKISWSWSEVMLYCVWFVVPEPIDEWPLIEMCFLLDSTFKLNVKKELDSKAC